MLSLLQAEYIGTMYKLQEIYLYKDDSGTEFYVDAIYIGQNPTTYDVNGMEDLALVLDSKLIRLYLYHLFNIIQVQLYIFSNFIFFFL